MTDITMPRLSDSMEEGIILTWLVEDGAKVAGGDELLEIETDKAITTHAAEASGFVEIVEPEGSTVAVGAVIARLGDVAVTPAPAPSPAAPPEAATLPAEAVDRSEPVVALAQPTAAAESEPAGSSRTLATPLARRIAAANGIDLDSIRGTGPRGRITMRDALDPTGESRDDEDNDASEPRPGSDGIQELSRQQQLIARRMTEAKSRVPHFQVETEVEMDELMEVRARFKALETGSVAPSINDFIIKASALALMDHPKANGSYQDSGFLLHDEVNVGMAVATDDALIVPVIKHADTKTIIQIAEATQLLAKQVRDGSITPADLSGGTFTVSNLGMFGMTAITPVINPPEAAILGVGAARKVLSRTEEGEIVERSIATLRLSCDHRILYGADASRFLYAIKQFLESPLRLVF